MKVLIGTGNSVTTVFSASARTITFSGAYNFDIDPSTLQIYNVARVAYMFGGGSRATGTVANSLVSGLRVQTVTLSSVTVGSLDADALVIMVDCPAEIAIYNATVKKT